MSSVVCVINSCCIGPSGRRFSSGKQPYMERLWLMRNVILPLYTKWVPGVFQEVIVVGEFEEGDGYRYVPCPSVYRSCVDALAQRQAGFEAITNLAVPWVLFQHDDHVWDVNNRVEVSDTADVLSPSRWTRGRFPRPERLADGSYHPPFTDNRHYHPSASESLLPLPVNYVNGHACLMRPRVFRNGFKWTDADKVFTWDVSVTDHLRRQGASIRYAPLLKVWDMERNATPWR